MAKPYSKLRHAMDDADISREDIACKLKCSRAYVDQRFRCEHPWTMKDAYTVLDMLKIPYSEVSEYFPNEKIKRRTA